MEDGEGVALDDSEWSSVTLPHTWNAEDTFTAERGYYRGRCWYRKRFTLSSEDCQKKVFIEFGAAFAVADVWINGFHIDQYMGGFTGMRVDATDHVEPGENLIAVAVDNRHDPEVLPGRETPDYNLYGGLYREASLVLKDRLHIAQYGVAITTPTVTPAIGTVCAGVLIRNLRPGAEEFTCTVTIKDMTGDLVVERREALWLDPDAERVVVFHFPGIRNPHLWSPDAPHLYSVTAAVEQGRTIIDHQREPLGFRAFEFTRDDGFRLNGEPLKLRGVNRHQDYPGLGNAVPERLQVRDAELIKEMGGNFVRTSHYPQHPAFLDACDRLGILVYAEIASWQHIGGERFKRNAETMLRQMIARDKNHPSVILWGLLNEGRDRDFFARLNAAAHTSDPSRATVYAENRPQEGRELGTVYVPDVLGINYKLPHLDDIRNALPDLKLICSEHTNADFAIRGDLDAEMRQLEQLKVDLDILDARPYMAGSALWSMHDYGTDYEPVWPVQHSGVLDACRLPKEGFYYVMCRWRRDPMLYLCGHWTWPGFEGRERDVAVVNNCDSIELFLNGRSLGVRQGESPAVWRVAYEPGELKAVGVKGGRQGQKILRTAGDATALRIIGEPDCMHADGRDIAELTVWVVDAAGTTVPCSGEVQFDVEGPGVLRGIGGRPTTALGAGLGRIALQATTDIGFIQVTARFADLPPAALEITAA
ncbi:MAG TPA: glycoside hydrolase family 2 TIM barrel-domain containing protein [Candidatus Hydrogenedentes bacterium]|nr:glycoside hydrolase family 2 TIM barrel-domain containing protein [Candidatus Hydrogenedentota bacterium]